MNTFYLILLVLTGDGGRDSYVIDYAFTQEDCQRELASETPFTEPGNVLVCSSNPEAYVN